MVKCKQYMASSAQLVDTSGKPPIQYPLQYFPQYLVDVTYGVFYCVADVCTASNVTGRGVLVVDYCTVVPPFT